MDLFQKLKLYKRLFLVFLAMNVVSMTAGVVFFVSLIFLKPDLEQSHKNGLLLIEVSEKVSQLSFDVKAPLSFKTWKTLREFQELLESKPEYKKMYSETGLLMKGIEESSLEQKMVEDYKASLGDHKLTVTQALKRDQSKIFNFTREIAIVGIVSLIFGIILPLVAMTFLGRLMLKTKADLQGRVGQWVVQFLDEKSNSLNSDEKWYQEPEFWVQMILISVETWGPSSKSQMGRYAGEISLLLRQEMKRAKEAKKAQNVA